MGGGIKVMLENQQYQAMTNELDNVEYIIYFHNFNTALFDVYRLQKAISKDISKYLNKVGIKNSELEVGGLGGGGETETLVSILKDLWQVKGFITFIYSAIITIKSFLVTLYFSKLKSSIHLNHPGVNISFRIGAKSNSDLVHELDSILASRLSNLVVIGNSVCNHIKEKYNFLQSIDLSVEGYVLSKKYTISLKVKDKFRSGNQINRLIKILYDTKIRTNLYTEYSFKNKLLIERNDIFTMEKANTIEYKTQKYYLVVSSKLLKD